VLSAPKVLVRKRCTRHHGVAAARVTWHLVRQATDQVAGKFDVNKSTTPRRPSEKNENGGCKWNDLADDGLADVTGAKWEGMVVLMTDDGRNLKTAISIPVGGLVNSQTQVAQTGERAIRIRAISLPLENKRSISAGRQRIYE
jgi:hypothetical protein